MSEVYYRIYVTRDDYVTTVCMQDFDEYHYDQDRFFKDDSGYKLSFDNEDEALEWLNENVKPEKIRPEDRRVKFNQRNYMR